MKALEQDRKVWENKIFRERGMLVAGDGPFPAFIRWYKGFYSENSRNYLEEGAGAGMGGLEW